MSAAVASFSALVPVPDPNPPQHGSHLVSFNLCLGGFGSGTETVSAQEPDNDVEVLHAWQTKQMATGPEQVTAWINSCMCIVFSSYRAEVWH